MIFTRLQAFRCGVNLLAYANKENSHNLSSRAGEKAKVRLLDEVSENKDKLSSYPKYFGSLREASKVYASTHISTQSNRFECISFECVSFYCVNSECVSFECVSFECVSQGVSNDSSFM